MAENGFDFTQERTALMLPKNLKSALLNYDVRSKRQKFEQTTFICGVCLEPKKGNVCHRLNLCGHVFCVECLQGYYENCIVEGNIPSVVCLAPDCEEQSATIAPTLRDNERRKKKDRTLEPSELLQIPLDQKTVERYTRLRHQRRIESNKNTIYCPRKWCQGPSHLAHRRQNSSSDSDASDNENDFSPAYNPNDPQSVRPPPSERLAICTVCTFAFCIVCKTSWHGPYVPCSPPRDPTLPGIAAAMDKATKAYIVEHTSVCPGCSACCQKSFGCNVMTCYRCKKRFCYLCSTLIEKSYWDHYASGQRCAKRLLVDWMGDNGEGHELVWDPHAGDGETLVHLFAEAPKEESSVRVGRGRR